MLSLDASGSGKHPRFLNSVDLNKRPFVVVFAATIMSFFCDICRGLAALGLAWAVWPSGLAAAEPEGIEFFENHISQVAMLLVFTSYAEPPFRMSIDIFSILAKRKLIEIKSLKIDELTSI